MKTNPEEESYQTEWPHNCREQEEASLEDITKEAQPLKKEEYNPNYNPTFPEMLYEVGARTTKAIGNGTKHVSTETARGAASFITGLVTVATLPYTIPSFIRWAQNDEGHPASKIIDKLEEMGDSNIVEAGVLSGALCGFLGCIGQVVGYVYIATGGFGDETMNAHPEILLFPAATNLASLMYECGKPGIKAIKNKWNAIKQEKIVQYHSQHKQEEPSK